MSISPHKTALDSAALKVTVNCKNCQVLEACHKCASKKEHAATVLGNFGNVAATKEVILALWKMVKEEQRPYFLQEKVAIALEKLGNNIMKIAPEILDELFLNLHNRGCSHETRKFLRKFQFIIGEAARTGSKEHKLAVDVNFQLIRGWEWNMYNEIERANARADLPKLQFIIITFLQNMGRVWYDRRVRQFLEDSRTKLPLSLLVKLYLIYAQHLPCSIFPSFCSIHHARPCSFYCFSQCS